jgi:hypothetical protein
LLLPCGDTTAEGASVAGGGGVSVIVGRFEVIAIVAGGGVCVAGGGGVSVVAGGGVCVAGGGGVSVVAGGACTGGGVSVVARGGASVAGGGGVSVVARGGASAVSSSSAGGVGNVGQLPLASGVEPSGHDCAYEGCSIDDDCTVRIAAVTRITLIIIDSLPFISVINFSLLLNSLSNNLYQGLKGERTR